MMKRMVSVLLALCLCLTLAAAEDVYAPALEEIWTEATLEDFRGYWELSVISSDQPVNMLTYCYLEILEDGTVTMNYGDDRGEVYYETAALEPENGVLFIADENGENGMYCFLFDVSLMGCAKTMEDPGTIWYLRGTPSESEADAAWLQELSARIQEKLIGAEVAMEVAEVYGEWKCWAYSNESGNLTIMDPAYYGMTLTIQEGQVELLTHLGYAEESVPAELVETYGGLSIWDESNEESYAILLRGEDELMMVDDVEQPTEALFFYTAQVWAEEEAAGAFDTGVDLGEQVTLTAMDQVAGLWAATHVNYFGMVMDTAEQTAWLAIDESGLVTYIDEDEAEEPVAVRLADGCLVPEAENSDFSSLTLYESGVLVQELTGEAAGFAIYFQRSDAE